MSDVGLRGKRSEPYRAERRATKLYDASEKARRGADIEGRGSQRSDESTSAKTLRDHHVTKQDMCEWCKLANVAGSGKSRHRFDKSVHSFAESRCQSPLCGAFADLSRTSCHFRHALEAVINWLTNVQLSRSLIETFDFVAATALSMVVTLARLS
jgi:hypothetical protein